MDPIGDSQLELRAEESERKQKFEKGKVGHFKGERKPIIELKGTKRCKDEKEQRSKGVEE